MLPYRPESLEAMQQRFPQALAEVTDVEYCRFGGETPGQKRKHIFDFEDGLRLIVSKDRLEDGRIVVHFSASAYRDSALYRRLKKPSQKKYFSRLAQSRFALLSGYGTEKPAFVEYIGASEKGVPHWHVTEVTEEEAYKLLEER